MSENSSLFFPCYISAKDSHLLFKSQSSLESHFQVLFQSFALTVFFSLKLNDSFITRRRLLVMSVKFKVCWLLLPILIFTSYPGSNKVFVFRRPTQKEFWTNRRRKFWNIHVDKLLHRNIKHKSFVFVVYWQKWGEIFTLNMNGVKSNTAHTSHSRRKENKFIVNKRQKLLAWIYIVSTNVTQRMLANIFKKGICFIAWKVLKSQIFKTSIIKIIKKHLKQFSPSASQQFQPSPFVFNFIIYDEA